RRPRSPRHRNASTDGDRTPVFASQTWQESAMATMTQNVQLGSPGPATLAAPPPERASTMEWIAVLAAMIGAFMAILNIQITNASLLDIEGGIGTGVDNGAWISTSYLIG